MTDNYYKILVTEERMEFDEAGETPFHAHPPCDGYKLMDVKIKETSYTRTGRDYPGAPMNFYAEALCVWVRAEPYPLP